MNGFRLAVELGMGKVTLKEFQERTRFECS